MSSNITRTVLGSALQTVLYTGRDFTLLANTTLNEKLGIQSGVAPASGKVPTLSVACIGIGGHRFDTGADSQPIVKSVKHDPTDFALYKQIPWVLRLATADLSQVERAKYALRKQITINSANYIAYYGRRIDVTSPTLELTIETITNGVSSSASFVPSAANLNPTPILLDETGSNAMNGQFVNVNLVTALALTSADVAEIINACTVIYGDANYAYVSELALVSGVDKNITLADGATFAELIAAQINAHVGVLQAMPFATDGWTESLNLGASEPLLRTV